MRIMKLVFKKNQKSVTTTTTVTSEEKGGAIFGVIPLALWEEPQSLPLPHPLPPL